MNRVAQSVPAARPVELPLLLHGARCGSVPLAARTPGGTPGELAGADACTTSRAGSWVQAAKFSFGEFSPLRKGREPG